MSAALPDLAARRRVPAAIPIAVTIAWAVSIIAQATGGGDLLSHDAVAEGDVPFGLGVALFAVAWVVMLAAMMLPSTIPMVRLFAGAAAGQPHRERSKVLAVFLGGYVVVWTWFGLAALGVDLVVHAAVGAVPWVEDRSWLLVVALLAGAGAFQFTELKDRCLDQCRHPAAFIIPRYRRGTGPAFSLGLSHGMFCLGCCWALMLLMFAAGVMDLRLMAGLAALMTYEKVGRRGVAVGHAAGWMLLAGALVVLGAGLT